jgi:hypothetical protein
MKPERGAGVHAAQVDGAQGGRGGALRVRRHLFFALRTQW